MRFNPSEPHAEIKPNWHGAAYKQNGRYYDSAGVEVITPNSPGNRPPDTGTRRTQSIQAAQKEASIPASGPMVTFSADKSVAFIDGTEYWKASIAKRAVELAEAKALKDDTTLDELDDDDADNQTPDPAASLANEPAAPKAPPANQAPIVDDLTEIKGIGAATVTDLQKLGLTSFVSLAALTAEEKADVSGLLSHSSLGDVEDWCKQAIAILAKRNPGAVHKSAPLDPTPPAELGREQLRAWAMRGDAGGVHWQTIRKSIESLFAVKVTNETDAVVALIKEGVVGKEEAKRG